MAEAELQQRGRQPVRMVRINLNLRAILQIGVLLLLLYQVSAAPSLPPCFPACHTQKSSTGIQGLPRLPTWCQILVHC